MDHEQQVEIGPGDRKQVRRVVTGHTQDHGARVLIDGDATNGRTFVGGTVSTLIWSTDRSPADIGIGRDIEDAGARRMGTAPPPQGSRFAVIDFAPHTTGPMHRTETIDYVVIVSGEIAMRTDHDVTVFRAGDVVVQRGTNHAWVNSSEEWARVAFVLLDAQPLDIGEPVKAERTP